MHKAGVAAFQSMLDALAEGSSIALSADVPKVARVAGLGVIKLAQASGRPIYPSAIATSRRVVLDNWDRTTINLPFSRGAGVAADPISVAADADDNALEACLLYTSLIGSGANLVTGDYSRGASGFWIENGERTYAVSEVTIAGHLTEMFASLQPANDLTFRYGTNAPTLRVEGLTVAGH